MNKEQVEKVTQLQWKMDRLNAEIDRLIDLVNANRGVDVYYKGTLGGGFCVMSVDEHLCELTTSDLDMLWAKKYAEYVALSNELEAI